MSLLEQAKADFCVMEKTRISDGEGGFTTTWSEGVTIQLMQRHDSTIEAQQAEKDGTASTYTFLFDKSMSFAYGDYVKRLSDDQIFRITQPSGEDATPSMSSLNLGMIKAEKGTLPS